MIKKTLYHKAKGGDIRCWSVWSVGEVVYTEYGVLNGQLQTSSKTCAGKNIGRSNETTPTQQADLEAQALYKFKLDRKYSETIEDAKEDLLLPMLAHKYNPEKIEKKDWYAQPKFNGVRCLAMWEGNRIILLSRSGKEYDVKHISDLLTDILPKNTVLDGEIYLHDTPLQEVISLVKKPKPGSEKLVYMVYDCPTVNGDDSLSFEKRYRNYLDIIPDNSFIKPVVCTKVDGSTKEINEAHRKYVENGYEGAMLRDPDGLYLWGYRSKELLKVKAFQDAEFEVISISDGVGKMEGHAVLTCKNDINDLTFNVTPKATMEQRKEIFDNKTKYIGRKYTVQFFERSVDGVPIFPVGIAFPEDR